MNLQHMNSFIMWAIAIYISALSCHTQNIVDAEGTVDGQNRILCGNSISKGFQRPINKQGIHDQRFYDNVHPITHLMLRQHDSGTLFTILNR